MLHKTRGIVFHTTKFSESGIIAKIFTEELGLVSVMVNSARGKKSKNKTAALQPLTLLELVVYLKENRGIQKVSEIRINPPFQTISTDIRKTSIVLFLADILRRAVHEEEVNKNLFQFIFHSLQILDLKEEGLNNFHLMFLLQLSRYLGFYPSGEYSDETKIFNLPEGCFQQGFPPHEHFMDEQESNLFSSLLNSSFESGTEITLPKKSRKMLLEKIIDYYRLHLPSFHEIHSHEILGEVMG